MQIDPILKVADKACNLNCSYCFYDRQTRDQKIMDLKVLEKVVYEVCSLNGENINFIWHGGEPLLAGIEFYQKAMEYQARFRKRGQKFTNNIQTNGTLIDGDWAAFLKKWGFNVGISLDGPREIHDKHRRFSHGEGSFDKVIEGLQILRKEKAEFSIISVITKETMRAPKETSDFLFSQHPLRITFVPALGISTGSEISYKYSIQARLYVDFLIEVFALWIERGDYQIRILPIETIIRGLSGKPSGDNGLIGECKRPLAIRRCERNLVIIPNGDLRTCAFHGYGDLFKFGNIRQGLQAVLSSDTYQKYKEQLDAIREKCAGCEWFCACHNGCPRDFHLGGGHGLFCEDYPRLFRYIQERLEEYQLSKGRHLMALSVPHETEDCR